MIDHVSVIRNNKEFHHSFCELGFYILQDIVTSFSSSIHCAH